MQGDLDGSFVMGLAMIGKQPLAVTPPGTWRSLDDPARAKAYLDVADQVSIDIAANRRITPPGS
jgi:hypothetical protein